jgi:hypothetical protein
MGERQRRGVGVLFCECGGEYKRMGWRWRVGNGREVLLFSRHIYKWAGLGVGRKERWLRKERKSGVWIVGCAFFFVSLIYGDESDIYLDRWVDGYFYQNILLSVCSVLKFSILDAWMDGERVNSGRV